MRAGARLLATTKTPPGGRSTDAAESSGAKEMCSAEPGAESKEAACAAAADQSCGSPARKDGYLVHPATHRADVTLCLTAN